MLLNRIRLRFTDIDLEFMSDLLALFGQAQVDLSEQKMNIRDVVRIVVSLQSQMLGFVELILLKSDSGEPEIAVTCDGFFRIAFVISSAASCSRCWRM